MTEYARVVNANGSRGPKVHIVNDHGRAKCDPHGTYTLERVAATLADAERMCKRCVHLVQRFEPRHPDQMQAENFKALYGNMTVSRDLFEESPTYDATRYGEQLMDPGELRMKLSSYWDPQRQGYRLGNAFVTEAQARNMTRARIAQLLLEQNTEEFKRRHSNWGPSVDFQVTFSVRGFQVEALKQHLQEAIGREGWTTMSFGGFGVDVLVEKIFAEGEMDESAAQ